MPQLDLAGLTAVPKGKVAAVVTSLEMTERPDLSPPNPPAGIDLRLVDAPEGDWYRSLFRAVGGDWLWSSRLRLDDGELAAILADRGVEVHVVRANGVEIGLLELGFRTAGVAEISFFGIVPGHRGKGLGRWMMDEALTRAWREGIGRVWLHTSTLDSPVALPFYRSRGFVPFSFQIEVIDDPRLTGLLPRSAAPQVAILE